MEMERYRGVRGKLNVSKTLEAIERCGGRVLKAPDPSLAPYEISVALPTGEVRDLVCYAFTANLYRQKKRPVGEHRLQVKYGNEFERYHDLFIDPRRRRLTLMFGVHHELDLFVAVDPIMHNPTRFSRMIGMKENDLILASQKGWHGWERARSTVRRKIKPPLESDLSEAIFAFKPEYFLKYVEAERLTQGLDASERLLLADGIARSGAPVADEPHPLEDLCDLSARSLLDVLGGTARLVTAVRGRVAEHHLGSRLREMPGISAVKLLDEDGQPDFSLVYNQRTFRIECKNVAGASKPERPRVDFQKTRAAKGDPCSRYYAPTQFEVLAACLHPVTGKWEYRFCATNNLKGHKSCPGKLSDRVFLDEPGWRQTLPEILDAFL